MITSSDISLMGLLKVLEYLILNILYNLYFSGNVLGTGGLTFKNKTEGKFIRRRVKSGNELSDCS